VPPSFGAPPSYATDDSNPFGEDDDEPAKEAGDSNPFGDDDAENGGSNLPNPTTPATPAIPGSLTTFMILITLIGAPHTLLGAESNPFGDVEEDDKGSNPFGDDDGEPAKESNPFGDDSDKEDNSNPFGTVEKEKGANPFGDDSEEDTNPF
jgi:hypothetical protein